MPLDLESLRGIINGVSPTLQKFTKSSEENFYTIRDYINSLRLNSSVLKPSGSIDFNNQDISNIKDLSATNIYSTSILSSGNNAGTNGQLLLKGSTSGTVTITTQAAAGTWSLTLPTSGGSSGQFLQTDGSGGTTWATASGGGGGGGITWNEVTGTSQSMAVDNGYIANNASLVTLTLPATAAVGKVVRVSGKGAGGWKIAQNASGIIHFGNSDTTTGTGGYLQSTHQRDSVELVCVVANNEWNIISSVGNITYV